MIRGREATLILMIKCSIYVGLTFIYNRWRIIHCEDSSVDSNCEYCCVETLVNGSLLRSSCS